MPVSCTLNQKGEAVKTETKVFIVAQLLDILVSIIGICFVGTVEIGFISGFLLPYGWGITLFVKFLTILFICLVLEKADFGTKLVWFIPGICIAVVVWNIVAIAITILNR